MAETNVDVARRGYEAARRGDIDALTEFFDPDVKWHGGDPTAPGACRNRREALEFITRAARRRQIGELVDLKDAGDRIVVIMRAPSAPGAPPELHANVTTFRDGKVVEIVHYATPEDALAAAAPAE